MAPCAIYYIFRCQFYAASVLPPIQRLQHRHFKMAMEITSGSGRCCSIVPYADEILNVWYLSYPNEELDAPICVTLTRLYLLSYFCKGSSLIFSNKNQVAVQSPRVAQCFFVHGHIWYIQYFSRGIGEFGRFGTIFGMRNRPERCRRRQCCYSSGYYFSGVVQRGVRAGSASLCWCFG